MLGAKRKHLAGLSSTAAAPHQGFVYASGIVQGTPPGLRTKAARLVAAKCALLARVDAYGQDPSGAVRTGTSGGGLVGLGGWGFRASNVVTAPAPLWHACAAGDTSSLRMQHALVSLRLIAWYTFHRLAARS